MSYYEGSNWQARKEDEGKPLFENPKTKPMTIPDTVLQKIKENANDFFDEWYKRLPVNVEKDIPELLYDYATFLLSNPGLMEEAGFVDKKQYAWEWIQKCNEISSQLSEAQKRIKELESELQKWREG